MPIEGKKARKKAQERNQTPDDAIKHERPFAVHTSARGPLSMERAKSAQQNTELNNELLKVNLRRSAS